MYLVIIISFPSLLYSKSLTGVGVGVGSEIADINDGRNLSKPPHPASNTVKRTRVKNAKERFIY
jgi:hypothetical protein